MAENCGDVKTPTNLTDHLWKDPKPVLYTTKIVEEEVVSKLETDFHKFSKEANNLDNM